MLASGAVAVKLIAYFLLAILGSFLFTESRAGVSPGGPVGQAVEGGYRLTYPTGYTGPGSGVYTRTLTPSTGASYTGGTITVTDQHAFLGPAGSPLGINAARGFGLAGLAAIAARCAANSMMCAGSAAVTGFGFWLDHKARIRKAEEAGKTGTGLYQDPGTPSTVQGVTQWTVLNSTSTVSRAAACTGANGYSAAAGGGFTNTYTNGFINAQNFCEFTRTVSPCSSGCTAQVTFSVSQSTVQKNMCPAYVDPLRGPIPAGETPFADGKCGTGIYGAVSEAVAATAVSGGTQNSADLLAVYKGFDDWIHGTETCSTCTSPATTGTVSPTSVTGPTTTSTRTDPTGTTVSSETPTYAPAWNQFNSTKCQTLSTQCDSGGIVTWPKTSVRTDTFTPAGGGTPVVTTTTTVDPGGEPSTEPQEQITQCDKYPETLGCASLGNPETITPEPVPQNTVDLAIVPIPVSDLYGGSASCPAPRTFSVLGKSFSFSWQPMCTFADGIKPVVVGLAFLSAALLFMGMGRGQA